MTRAGRAAAGARLAVWCAGLVLAARVLVATGQGALRIPLTSATGLATWVGAASPAEMAVAVMRLLAIAGCAYLLGVTALGVVARLVRARGLAAVVDRISPALVRGLVSGGTGAGLVLGTLVAALPAPDMAGPPAASTVAAADGAGARPVSAPGGSATMTRTAPGTAAMTRTAGTPTDVPAAPEGGEATMTRLDAGAGRSATMARVPSEPAGRVPPPAPVPVTPAAVAAGPVLPVVPPLPPVDGTAWRVEPGDSLWSIAEEVVRSAHPGAPGRVVTRFWQDLVAANRATLVDPGNPDLLVPGQELTVPAFRG